MLITGAKVGIVCCSNGQKREYAGKIERLEAVLRTVGLQPVLSDHIYVTEKGSSGTGRERAKALMDFYQDDRIKGIFDISGGDLANGVLPFLDYKVIANSDKTFWGYSDLTTVINAIYAKTGKASVLYQIRNLIYEHGERQTTDFRNSVIEGGDDLFRIDDWVPVAGQQARKYGNLQGTVVGGNIRCFLKLAGTEYMPELAGKVLLLESYRGTAELMESYLSQLEQLGAFRKVSGILLGTFTEMQEKKYEPPIETLVRRYAGDDLPIAVTRQIGHGTDSKGIWIGKPGVVVAEQGA